MPLPLARAYDQNMSLLLLIPLAFGAAFGAFCIWLIVRFINLQDRRTLVELAELGAAIFVCVAIAGATAMVRVLLPVR